MKKSSKSINSETSFHADGVKEEMSLLNKGDRISTFKFFLYIGIFLVFPIGILTGYNLFIRNILFINSFNSWYTLFSIMFGLFSFILLINKKYFYQFIKYL
ncbi:MAG: hypothetical protein NDI94_04775 [Candidatus Woesearchaeota archaeon]|nr:hypothetical protein [Candidatus Woesearchaeota archaeon]